MIGYLDTFCEVARQNSFSLAAQSLRISQPAVSRQIRLLEESLDVQLFVRDRHRIDLTHSGRELFRRVSVGLDGIAEAVTELVAERDKIAGRVRVACLQESGPFVAILSRFRSQNPDVVIELEYGHNNEVIRNVKQGVHDLGIVSLRPEVETLRAHTLFKERFVLVTRKANRQSLEDFRGLSLPFVRFRTSTHVDGDSMVHPYLKRFKRSLRIHGIETRFAVNSIVSMIDVLLRSDLYAVLPHHFVAEHLKKNRLRLVSDKSYEKPLYLLHVDNPYMSKTVQAVKSVLLRESREVE